MIDASIPLQVKAPEVSTPFQNLGALMQLKNSGQEFLLRQAQAQDAAAQAAQRTADLHDQGVIRDAMTDPDKAKRIGAQDYSDIQGLVQPNTLDKVREATDAHITKQLANTKEQNQIYKEHTEEVTKGLAGLQQMAHDDDEFEAQLPAAYHQFMSNMAGQGKLDFFSPEGQPPKTVDNPRQLTPVIAALGMHNEALDKALAIQKTRQDTNKIEQEAVKAGAEAGKITAETPGVKADSDVKEAESKLQLQAIEDYQNGTQGTAHPIDSVLPTSVDKQGNADYKAAFDSAMKFGGPKAAQAVVEKAAEHAGGITANTAKIPGDIQKSIATETALSPIKVNQAVQTEIQKAKLAPGAVSGILNPTLQNKVIGDWTKASDEYQAKVGDAQRLHAFVEAARSGNQNAVALLPLSEVREIVNRVNSQELNAAGGGVSWARNIQNWVDKGATGKPSTETLDEMDRVADMTLGAAKRVWSGKVNNLNTLGAKFPTEPPDLPAASDLHKSSTGGGNLPTEARSKLQEGHNTTFGNGQVWTLKNGEPVQVK